MSTQASAMPSTAFVALNARGGWGRAAALALSLVALFLPGIVVQSSMGSVGSFTLMSIEWLAVVFPPMIAVTMAASAVPAFAAAMWTLHIVAIVVGGASFFFLWKELATSTEYLDAMGGPFDSIYGGMGGYLDMGAGGYALLGALALMLIAPLIGGRRRAAA